MKRVGVVLSGCGVYDGSEIHEAVLALLALDRKGSGREVEFEFSPELAARLSRDAATQRRRERTRAWLRRVYTAPGIGRPFRSLYRRVQPRL